MFSLKKLNYLVVVFLLAGCGNSSDEEGEDTGTGQDTGKTDAGGSEGEDSGTVDGGEGEGEGEGIACSYPADCITEDSKGDCVEGHCLMNTPPRCQDDTKCPAPKWSSCDTETQYCIAECEGKPECVINPRPCRKNRDCPDWTTCHDGRCINDCETDLDCPEDGYCLEGECLKYPDIWTGSMPVPQAEAGQVLIGVGVVPMDFPVGISGAGFGKRGEAYSSPYQVQIAGLDRVFEEQKVIAVAIDNGSDIAILLRLPLSWVTDYVFSMSVYKLQQLTGVNYYDKIIMGSTHSHSQPARYWNLVPEMGFGVFGYDEFSWEMFNRYTNVFAEAMYQALQNMRPGKVGYAYLDNFDPDDDISGYRRQQFNGGKDNTLFMIRFDEEDGTPRALLVSFAVHGTIFNKTWLTGDSSAGVEVIAQKELAKKFNREVPVMFMNGNAGDVSPSAGEASTTNEGEMQVLGKRVWKVIEPAFDSIQTTSDVSLEIASRSIPINYNLLGYKWGEFYDEGGLSKGQPYYYGAFQCVNEQNELSDEDMNTRFEDGHLGCIFGVEFMMHYPIPQYMGTLLSALRLNNLVMFTMPGESHSSYGREIREEIKKYAEEAGEKDITVVNIGYSQDHFQYIMSEDDWWQGGYEPSMAIWGWKSGTYLAEQAIEVAKQLFTPEKEDNYTGVKPAWWPDGRFIDDTLTPTDSPKDGVKVTLDVPTKFKAVADFMAFEWFGGHTGVDLPKAFLEYENPEGNFETFTQYGIPYDTRGFETVTIYKGDYATDHTWRIEWEADSNLPAGKYRWRIEGNYYADSKKNPYTIYTSAFDVEQAGLVIRKTEKAGTGVDVYFTYPNAPSTDDGTNDFATLSYIGHLLHRDGYPKLSGDALAYADIIGAPLKEGASVTVEIKNNDTEETLEPQNLVSSISSGEIELVVSRTSGAEEKKTVSEVPMSKITLNDLPEGNWTIKITDGYGNIGEATYINGGN